MVVNILAQTSGLIASSRESRGTILLALRKMGERMNRTLEGKVKKGSKQAYQFIIGVMPSLLPLSTDHPTRV